MLENELLRVEIGADGTLHRVFDKEARPRGPRRARQPALGLRRQAAHLGRLGHRGGLRDGGRGDRRRRGDRGRRGRTAARRGARRARAGGDLAIDQTYRLLAGSRRLDIETEIDWHERQVLLRALLPAGRPHPRGDLRDDVRRDAPPDPPQHLLGRRPLRGQRPPLRRPLRTGLRRRAAQRRQVRPLRAGQRARRSACCAARSTPTRWPTRASTASPTASSPTPATGPRPASSREAFALNSPLVVAAGAPSAAGASSGSSRPDGVELALGSLKRAEDGRGVILRLYEPHGARGERHIALPPPGRASRAGQPARRTGGRGRDAGRRQVRRWRCGRSRCVTLRVEFGAG